MSNNIFAEEQCLKWSISTSEFLLLNPNKVIFPYINTKSIIFLGDGQGASFVSRVKTPFSREMKSATSEESYMRTFSFSQPRKSLHKSSKNLEDQF